MSHTTGDSDVRHVEGSVVHDDAVLIGPNLCTACPAYETTTAVAEHRYAGLMISETAGVDDLDGTKGPVIGWLGSSDDRDIAIAVETIAAGIINSNSCFI